MIDNIKCTTTLSNGVKMPWLGLGVFQIRDLDECRAAVTAALDCGYRAIDTAAGYRNEEAVGEAVRSYGIPREEIFVTSTLSGENGYDRAYTELDNTLGKLGFDYLDLYLIHWPRPHEDKYVETFKAFREMYEAGKIRAIGVSNFPPEIIDRVYKEVGIYPMVNQVECHPRFQQLRLKEYCRDKGIQLECYSPLMNGQLAGVDAVQNVLRPIAEKYGKTVYQICLRWQLDSGVVCIAKSVHAERILQNSQIFDFALDADDMAKIAALDNGQHIFRDPYDDLGPVVHYAIN